MASMFNLAGRGTGVMPNPDDNPNKHVVPHHESGTRISFEILNVGDQRGDARTVLTYVNPGSGAADHETQAFDVA